jgi:NAD(P)-dependent dehydrogenase (short-subunit alcohol dehydrogenase family)
LESGVDSFRLNDKVVVVTGGAGVIGRGFVHAIAASGGTAIVADIDERAAAVVAQDVASLFPGRAEPFMLDITRRESVAALIHSVHKRFGRLDAVVNNAYPRNENYGRKLEEVSYEDFCANLNLHLGGYFLIMQQFALHFRASGGGNIVNMASIYGVVPPRFEIYAHTSMTMPVEYAAIKSAIVQLTRYFAQCFKFDGIRVNCISPGGILAGQPPEFLEKYNSHCGVKGMLDPQDVSGCLLFLLSDASRYMNGQNLIVDDSFTL